MTTVTAAPAAATTAPAPAAVVTEVAPAVVKGQWRKKALGAAGALVYLQQVLSISASAAAELQARGSWTGTTSLLQQDNCQGWVGYLTRLSEGDISVVRGTLHTYPRLLSQSFSVARRDNLERVERLLTESLGVDRQYILTLVQKYAPLLTAAPTTIEAALGHLQAHVAPDELHAKLLNMPKALCNSDSSLQEKLLWATHMLGMPCADASLLAMRVLRFSVVNTLEPHRQWLLARGFSPADIVRIVQRCPCILHLSLSKLDHRLRSLSCLCHGTPQATDVDIEREGVARRLIVSQPPLFSRDLDSELMKLKLRFWRDGLGFSSRDLQHGSCGALFMLTGMTRIVTRTHMLKHLLSESVTLARLSDVLICGSGATQNHFGPCVFTRFVKEQLGTGSGATSVTDVLSPLVAKLNHPQSQQAWLDRLHPPPSQSPAGERASEKLLKLYAGLCDAYLEDCQHTPAVREWLTAAAAAEVADGEARSAARKAQVTDRAAVKASRPPRKRKGRTATSAHVAAGSVVACDAAATEL